MIGRHKRQGIRRRRGKAIVIAIILAMSAITSSVFVADRKEPKKVPSESELVYMRNVARLSPGEAAIYVEQWPEYADYIMGLTDEVDPG